MIAIFGEGLKVSRKAITTTDLMTMAFLKQKMLLTIWGWDVATD